MNEHKRFVFDGIMYYFYFDFDEMTAPKLVTVRTLEHKLPLSEADQRATSIARFLFGLGSRPNLSWVEGWEGEFAKG